MIMQTQAAAAEAPQDVEEAILHEAEVGGEPAAVASITRHPRADRNQHLRIVEIRSDLDRDRQRVRPVTGTGRLHVDHVLDAVHLLLDGRGDRLRDHVRRGAGVGDAHHQHRQPAGLFQ